MKAIVADRGQVTIPKVLRDRLGITPRTVLEFREENGRLVAEKAILEDPVTKVLGCLKLKKSTDHLLDDLRGRA
ncbi:MAG: AbrB/MazE/SpoVT family DNA-binding domain-containing protein [Candidatus Hydrogenedentes bacterium]|nr:AbrB/MazE/SpoVT family DNA-binding domain-containing protein [Candidatus Hydrogenedentota bacterium]